MKKFHVLSLALAAGIISGIGVFLLAIFGMYGVAEEIVTLIGSGYIGFEATWTGAFIGLAWGFVDGFVGIAIFALLYNFLVSKFK